MNYEAIRIAMQAELEDTEHIYMPCSPGEFVRDRLFRDCMWEEAAWFWGCWIRRGFNIPELDALYNKLKDKDKSVMPSWGTYGT